MKLKIKHSTRYEYASPVRDGFNEVRLKPRAGHNQSCESFSLTVQPTVQLSHFTDFRGNLTHFFEIADPHHTLVVESTATVTTIPYRLPQDALLAPMSRAAECLRIEGCFDYLQASTYVERSPEAWRLALDITADQTDMWHAAQSIMRYVHGNFVYSADATNVHTHMRDVLRDRRGVCQDLAHVMIGLCRAVNIPALYVSGYLYNGPRDTLLGAQASHAWCEIFLPDVGWHGLDPTNNQPTDERYIKLAVGTDYAEVPPIRGHYRGASQRQMSIEVHVDRLDD